MSDQTTTPTRMISLPPLPLAARSTVILVLVGAACALPFLFSNYHLFQLTLVMANAIALLGLNLLTGYNGQISLGHGAFYGIGAYTAAVLMNSLGVHYVLAVACAAGVCFCAGFLFGLPALRLEGLYLALATFALGMSLPQILKYKHLARWTGGSQGILLDKPTAPFGIALSADQWLYLFTLSIALIMFMIARNLIESHVGRAIVAVRDHPVAAATMGVHVARTKALTFGVSVMYTGIAGALTALSVQFVAPDSFLIPLSITLLVGVVVGGLASISGALYGALFIQFVPNLADHVSKAMPGAVFGLVLIVFAYAMPFGIAGFIKRMLLWAKPTRLR
jgi:branched-chain amino acid transport system permease protein